MKFQTANSRPVSSLRRRVVDIARFLEHHLVGEGLKCSGVLGKVECEQGVDIHHL
ncbi:MAG: hypothetical protein ACLS3M_09690 [Collinsella sp.]